MTEMKNYTTGVQTVKMKPEFAKIIWVRNCRSCKSEFKTDDPKRWTCDACTKTYGFELSGLALAKKEEIEVPLNELRIVEKNE